MGYQKELNFKGFLCCLSNLGFHGYKEHLSIWTLFVMVQHKPTQLYTLLIFFPSFISSIHVPLAILI